MSLLGLFLFSQNLLVRQKIAQRHTIVISRLSSMVTRVLPLLTLAAAASKTFCLITTSYIDVPFPCFHRYSAYSLVFIYEEKTRISDFLGATAFDCIISSPTIRSVELTTF